MTPRKTSPTKVPVNLPEPDEIAVPEQPVNPPEPDEIEQHVPVVAADDMALPKRLIEIFDRVVAEGKPVDAGDGCKARLLDAPKESALVNLPKAQLLFVNCDERHPHRWLPVAHLQKAVLNGWDYVSAKRLYADASVPIYMALEHEFGRGDVWDPGRAHGELDAPARKMTGVERTDCDALVEIDNKGDFSPSGSRVQYVRWRACWLALRRIGRLGFRPVPEQRSYPNIKVL